MTEERQRNEELRRQAEERLGSSGVEACECTSEMDVRAVLHELQVHQIELELQNDELQRARDELEQRVEERTEDLRLSEAKYRTLFESMSEGFALHEVVCNDLGRPTNYRFLDVNKAFTRLTGLTREQVVGKTVLEVLPGTESYWIDAFGKVALTGEPAEFQQFSGALGKHFEVHAYSPRRQQFAVLFLDVTQRKLAENQQKEFYRRTILAATQGKLAIVERSELRESLQPALKRWEVKSTDDISLVQNEAAGIAESSGIDGTGICRLTTCVLESLSNALKYAGSATASLHPAADGLVLLVEDNGPGIAAMAIPDLALRAGYSTKGTLGAGYKMMIASSRKVYLATGPDGTSAAFEIPLNTDDTPHISISPDLGWM